MSGAAIIAWGAISALGEGRDATSAGEVGRPARIAIATDAELTAAGLARPFVARATLAPIANEDRATTILLRALAACAAELDRTRAAWRSARVGLVLGTSSGGMRRAEELFVGTCDDAEAATYFGPMLAAARALGVTLSPATLVLGACASSTLALGLASRWLDAGDCDLVLAGGFDAVSVFVAAGFEVLRATSGRVPPAPFRIGRDGMALGEGAAVLALVRADDASSGAALAYVAGFGASADAVHLTAPDRTGAGLARAARAALDDAGLPASSIGLVSAHATATPFNDAAESRALASVGVAHAVVHPFKAQIGHTLGAAGALESLACVDAMERGVLPAAAGLGELDPDAPARLLTAATAGAPQAALKLSSAFGGANAALVLTRRSPPCAARVQRDAFVTRASYIAAEPELDALASRLGWTADRLMRTDLLTRLALAALAELSRVHGPLTGAALVVGHTFATLETNATYYERIRTRGARMAEPRRFPYTSPNAVAGECSLAFACTGPCFAVGTGLHAGLEALAVGALLVRVGDAERAVVVAVDEVGETVRRLARHAPFEGASLSSGAVAALVTRASGPAGECARIGSTALQRGPGLPTAPLAPGHRGLLPLAGDSFPLRLAAAAPPDGFASVELEPR